MFGRMIRRVVSWLIGHTPTAEVTLIYNELFAGAAQHAGRFQIPAATVIEYANALKADPSMENRRLIATKATNLYMSHMQPYYERIYQADRKHEGTFWLFKFDEWFDHQRIRTEGWMDLSTATIQAIDRETSKVQETYNRLNSSKEELVN